MNHPEGQQQRILWQLWVGLPRSHRVKDNHYTSFFDKQKQLHNMPRTLYATCNLNRHCFSVCLRGTGHICIGRSRSDVNNWVNVTKNLGLLTRVRVSKKVSEGNRPRPPVQQPFGRYVHCVYKQHPEHSQKMLPDHLQSYLDYSEFSYCRLSRKSCFVKVAVLVVAAVVVVIWLSK